MNRLERRQAQFKRGQRYGNDRNLPWPVIDTPGAVVAPIEAVDLNTPVRAALTWRHHRDAFLERYWALTAQCGPAPVGQQQTKATP